MDGTIKSVMNESSIDYMSNYFEDLAREIGATQTDDKQPHVGSSLLSS